MQGYRIPVTKEYQHYNEYQTPVKHRSSFVIKYQLCVLEPCYTGYRVLVLAMPGYCPGSFYTGVLAMGTGVMLPGY